ncbi:OPT oligopeptide transporter protein-domain-containing protein [Catenaria anguillulae PL171]|uniref:OPT oligopeptide transporter protein-domain-containing protein n=1 Tax=Catenaria anguillulae PL171 TaxID=765915 RepID=A0A1Y2HPX8_9FUNG|nr:OPT oligopeptide transporter protein-domain-containing protein [Catenaria anguillulae PL171]
MTEKIEKPVKEAGDLEKQESSFVVDAEFEKIVSGLAPTTDDVSTPSLTFRVFVLGFIFCFALGAINTLFMFRANPYSVSSYVATLLSYPLGVLMAKTLPRFQFNFLGIPIDTNPGPFSVKEHVLIGIFGSTGASGIYGVDNLAVQEIFYDLDIGHFWGILFLLTSSTLGFGISGICRRFLVRPKHMIWPTVLPSVALYTTLHHVDTAAVKDDGKKHMSQLKVFGIGALAMGIWHLFPNYIAPMLQYLPLLCWFSPKDNLVLQRLGSPQWGNGILSLTLDWSAVGSGPMSIPFWAAANQIINAVLFVWIIAPISHYQNWFNQPKSSDGTNTTRLFDKNGVPFAGNSVVDKVTKDLIVSKFEERAPIHFTTQFCFAYFGHFASLVAAVTHAVVWYGSDIANRFKKSMSDDADADDIHCQLIDKYPEVPDNWYYVFFAFTAILSILVGQLSAINMPWWSMLLVIVISFTGTIPIAIVLATAGVALYMNVVSQFIIGLLMPGKPIIMMAFKCFGVTVSMQCLTLLTDLKLGHYMKIPPRHIFISQIVAQVLSVFICYATMRIWLLDPKHSVWVRATAAEKKTMTAVEKSWTSYTFNVYYSASLIWGAIGPKRFFFDSQYGSIIIGGAIAGLILPILLKMCHKFIGGGIWQLMHPALLLSPASPGANNGIWLTSFLLSTFTQFYMYRWHQGTWKRYNYVLATGFDIGVAITTLLITFVFSNWEFPSHFFNHGSDSESTAHGTGPYYDWCYVEEAEA